MKLDLRLPIGILFSLYGVLLLIYGLLTSGSEMYGRSLGININVVWSVVMLVFGLVMLVLALRSRKKS